MVEKYFQEVVVAVEQSVKRGAGGRENYLNKLQQVYGDILSASRDGVCSALCCCSTDQCEPCGVNTDNNICDRAAVLSLPCALR